MKTIFSKTFLQNNLWKWKFSQMKNFFDVSRRSDIFGFVKKKYEFCTKNHNSKYLQNTKKIFTPWKSSKSQLSKDIRFSTQTQGMTKIWSKQKKLYREWDFFLSLTVYHIYKSSLCWKITFKIMYTDIYSRGQKKRRTFWNFFWNGYNFVSFWDWVENVISFES